MAYRLHADRTSHDRADVERLCYLRVRGTQVEDLLHAMLDSVEADLHHGHREGSELLVLLAQRPVREPALTPLSHRGRHLHGALGDQPIQPLPLLVLLVQMDHAFSFGGSSLRIWPRPPPRPP